MEQVHFGEQKAQLEITGEKKAKSGAQKAVVPTPRKIAAICYKVVTQKVEFNPPERTKGKEKYLRKKTDNLKWLRNRLKCCCLIISNKTI